MAVGLAAVADLVSPFGVVSSVSTGISPTYPGIAPRGLPELHSAMANAGRIDPRVMGDEIIYGSGNAMGDPELARLVAIAEGAERYAGGDFLGEERVWATAAELSGRVIEPQRFPKCSPSEYAHPRCPVVPNDPAQPIRWVRGTELTSGEPIWVPATMSCYWLRDQVPDERFVPRISTGYAVHTDPAEAVLAGILEVVERDAISLVWRRRLPVPLVGRETTSDLLATLTGWATRHFIQPSLFDVTTDLGLPTVYCVLQSEHSTRLRHVVSAGTARTLTRAAEKALLETIVVREFLRLIDQPPPATLDEVESHTDGSRFMAHADRAGAFDFLLSGAEQRAPVPRNELPDDPRSALAELADVFRERDMPVAVVDRTPTELAKVGLTGVSVSIPDLIPMSGSPYAQFTAQPRLYTAPVRMGFPAHGEEELNPWPQPF